MKHWALLPHATADFKVTPPRPSLKLLLLLLLLVPPPAGPAEGRSWRHPVQSPAGPHGPQWIRQDHPAGHPGWQVATNLTMSGEVSRWTGEGGSQVSLQGHNWLLQNLNFRIL